MNKRLLDFSASDFLKVSPLELKQAILASEGRPNWKERQVRI